MPGFEQKNGVFLVHYQHPSEMQPAAQRALVEAVRAHGTQEASAILFHVDRGVLGVDPSVPKFWLETVDSPAFRVVGMAIVSDSLAVRMAASAFDIANILRRKPLTVKSFTVLQRAAAEQWLHDLLHDANAAPPPQWPRPSI